ncbi:hypothetical protein GDO78_000788 [Eleutherodactylus coqui]|uniref:Sodium/hydrogen exchanger regulatory region domain-containing protein n=1 Tax=Eleutherodactylus coqui TaxID=57060 RepID=A0A8J6KGU7_ELECQ|nr:hypothetical protein GDO78_000788 [Eleutherodactylus coqui]
MDHVKAGITDICGHWGHYKMREKFKKVDHKFLRRALIRENQPKSSIVDLHKKLEIKQAIEMTEFGMNKNISKTSLQSYRKGKHESAILSEDVTHLKDLLTNSLYSVRQRTSSYVKYNLPKEDSERQNREIVINRFLNMKKGSSLPWGNQKQTQNVQYLSLPHNYKKPWEYNEQESLQGSCTDEDDSVFEEKTDLLISPGIRLPKPPSGKMKEQDGTRSKARGVHWPLKPKKQMTARSMYQPVKSRPYFDIVVEEEQDSDVDSNNDVL